MLKLLFIEILLTAIFGAVLYRVSWAFTKKVVVSWAVVLIAAAAILLLVPGHLDEALVAEYTSKVLVHYELSPLMVNLLRCLGLLAGAWLASRAVAARRKRGLEDEPPYKDFP